MKLKALMLIIVFAIIAAGVSASSDSEWNAGAIIIQAYKADGSGMQGQGYIAHDEYSESGYSVFTLQHVIEGSDYVLIFIPPRYEDYLSMEIGRFFCIERPYDDDQTCGVELTNVESDILLDEYDLEPYVRVNDHPELHVGALIASPRPDTGLWTVYEVSVIYEDSIEATALELIHEDGTSEIVGNFCHSRSGGPAVLVEFGDGWVNPFYRRGAPIVVGEMEAGYDYSAIYDYVDPHNRCYTHMIINRTKDET